MDDARAEDQDGRRAPAPPSTLDLACRAALGQMHRGPWPVVMPREVAAGLEIRGLARPTEDGGLQVTRAGYEALEAHHLWLGDEPAAPGSASGRAGGDRRRGGRSFDGP